MGLLIIDKHFEKSFCRMTSLVVLFSYQIKSISRQVRRLQKLNKRSYITILTQVSNAIIKLWGKISFHNHFRKFSKTLKDNFRPCLPLLEVLKVNRIVAYYRHCD